MTYWVYILRCADGTLYTGITDCLERRLAAHNSGRGAKYTWAWSTGRPAPTSPPPCAGNMPSSSSPGVESWP